MEQKLHDIYDVWHVPFWQRAWFFWSVCALALVVLILIVGIIIKKYRSRKKMVVVAPWDAALQSLSMLQQEKVATIEQGGNLYAAITRILKNYVHQRYGFDIASKTDDELVVYLEQNHFDPLLLSDIREIFEGSVYIKFAHVHVMQERIEKDLERSIAFVKATVPVQTKK
jgi:hypothetical protein